VVAVDVDMLMVLESRYMSPFTENLLAGVVVPIPRLPANIEVAVVDVARYAPAVGVELDTTLPLASVVRSMLLAVLARLSMPVVEKVLVAVDPKYAGPSTDRSVVEAVPRKSWGSRASVMVPSVSSVTVTWLDVPPMKVARFATDAAWLEPLVCRRRLAVSALSVVVPDTTRSVVEASPVDDIWKSDAPVDVARVRMFPV